MPISEGMVFASGSIAAPGAASDRIAPRGRPFMFALAGTWAGTVALEVSGDFGATWHNCLMPDGTASAFATNGARSVPNVYGRDAIFRLNPSLASGTLQWSAWWS